MLSFHSTLLGRNYLKKPKLQLLMDMTMKFMLSIKIDMADFAIIQPALKE